MDETGQQLRVCYHGGGDHEVGLDPRRALTFGREADLVLDQENRFLHREAGRFRHKDGRWQLQNTGSILHVQLVHRSGQVVELPPGDRASLPSGVGTVRLTAGSTTYEIGYELDPSGTTTVDPPALPPSDTVPYGRALTPRQIDVAVTLARHRLVGLRLPPPGHAEIARLWGMTARNVGKTIEEIRRRLREGEFEVEGIETQETLIEHLVTNRLVTLDDLDAARLDDPDGPVSRTASHQQIDRPRVEDFGPE